MKLMKWLMLCTVLLIAAIPAGLPPASRVDAAAAVEPAQGFLLGVCSHTVFIDRPAEQNMDAVRKAGFNAVRESPVWLRVETSRGQLALPKRIESIIDAALGRNLTTLLMLGGVADNGNPVYQEGKPTSPEVVEAYARYCEFVVRKYTGRVHLYEIWNEWDIVKGHKRAGKSNLDAYLKLLKTVYPRIKAIDPNAIVLGPTMTAFNTKGGDLEYLVRNGLLKYCDAVSLHTYTWKLADQQSRTPEAWAVWMSQVEAMLTRYNNGREVPLYITEMGWPVGSYRGKEGVSESEQAVYLARLYLLGRTLPFVKGVWWYKLNDHYRKKIQAQSSFGIYDGEGNPRLSFFAMSDIADIVKNGSYLGRTDSGDPKVWILRYRLPGGKDVWALWSSDYQQGYQVTLRSSGASPKPLTVLLVGNRAGTQGAAQTVPFVQGKLSVQIGRMPVLVQGDLAAVTIGQVQKN